MKIDILTLATILAFGMITGYVFGKCEGLPWGRCTLPAILNSRSR